MIQKILRGYSAVLGSTLRFVALIGVCVATGFLLVYPLWKLAVTRPDLYTLIFIFLLSAFIIGVFIMRVKKEASQNPKRFLLSLTRKAVLLAGLIGFVSLILSYERVLAFAALILTALVYGYLAFVLSSNTRTSDSR
ncbi:MAG TPA: hypothetical protein GXZ47_01375 [Treponema sp.]|nr:hypothetical protein [Treponema sp.]